MGLCGGKSSGEDAGARQKSQEIDAALRKDKGKLESEVKLLLLGT
jgi:hypothetical protein